MIKVFKVCITALKKKAMNEIWNQASLSMPQCQPTSNLSDSQFLLACFNRLQERP